MLRAARSAGVLGLRAVAHTQQSAGFRTSAVVKQAAEAAKEPLPQRLVSGLRNRGYKAMRRPQSEMGIQRGFERPMEPYGEL